MSTKSDDKIIEQQQGRYLETILPEYLNPEFVRKLPLEFLKKQLAIPLLIENGQVAIALADPFNIEAYDAISNILGRPCSRIISSDSEIERAISRCYYQSTGVGNDDEFVLPY